MKKIAIILNPISGEESKKTLRRLKDDFASIGAEIVFYGQKEDDLIKPLEALAEFEGTVINLALPGELGQQYQETAKIESIPEVSENRPEPAHEEIPPTENTIQDYSELKVTVEGVFLDKSGYALHTRNMALGLDKLGTDVKLNSMWFAGAPEMSVVKADEPRTDGHIYLSDKDGTVFRYKSQVGPEQTKRVLDLCLKKADASDRIFIAALPPCSPTDEVYKKIMDRKGRGETYRKYIGYTMFETADLPHGWAEACNLMDEIWVPSNFNYHSFAHSGVEKDKLRIAPLGVDINFFDPNKTPPMQIPGVKGFNFLSIFQWTKRKGWDILLKAYLKTFKLDDDVALVIRSYRGSGREVESVIREYIEELGRDVSKIPRISVISEPIAAQYMPSLYKACQAFVLPTRGEGWGLPYMEAMAMGLPVIGTAYSAQLDFMHPGNSFLIENLGTERVDEDQVMDDAQYLGTTWGIPSLEHTIELMRYVYENYEAAKKIAKQGREEVLNNWTVEHQALRTAETLAGRKILPKKTNEVKLTPIVIKNKIGKIRIAMQNRPNALEAPGGDTVVMQSLKRELEKLGAEVDFNFKMGDLSGYDVVHIYNFVLPEMVKLYADNAFRQNKPFIITPMYEDWPRFLNQSAKTLHIFQEYIGRRQPKEWFEEQAASFRRLKPHRRPDNSYSVRLAGGITPSGAREADRIKADYNFARNIVPVYLGCDILEKEVSSDLFIKETGLKDFVLCVARLETRKNQLMMLKALEDEDIPVVFATGGFTYQEPYAELCRRFKRRGKTVFLGRLSEEMLVSAYKAAKVHALPSWYELPGMVSVEAAHYDCNVVASPWGTIEDYLGDYAYYCEPDDAESIRRAVMQAMNDAVKPGLKDFVKQFTWNNTAETTLELYRKVRAEHRELKKYKLEGDAYKSAGKIDEALQAYNQALTIHPDHPEVLASAGELLSFRKAPEAEAYLTRLNLIKKDKEAKAPATNSKLKEGAVFEEMSEMEEAFELLKKDIINEAEIIFKAILLKNPHDDQALFGLGKVYMQREDFSQAKEYLKQAADLQPTGENLIALAEALEKVNQLEEAMTSLQLLRELPGVNGSFEFDFNRLKGHCLLKQGKLDEAERCYQKSHILDRASEKPYLGLGSVELMKKNYAVAEQYYRKALEKKNTSDKAHLGLAVIKMEEGDFDRAFDEAKRALDLRIENQQAMLVLIRSGHQCRRLNETAKYLADFSSLHPANVEVLFTLAGILYKTGRVDEALSTARKILLFEPENEAALNLLQELEKSNK